MKAILAMIALANLLTIVGIVGRNLYTRNYELFSWRNLFLLGFAHFQCLGAYFTATIITPHTDRYVEEESAHLILAILTPLFFILFMISARIAYKSNISRRYLPGVDLPVTLPGILLGVGAMLGFGLIFAIMPPNSYLGLLGVQFRGGLATASTALATYILLSKKFNPLSWTIFFAVLAVSVVVATVGTSTRRPLLGVMVAVPWMYYFFVLRYRPWTAIASRGAIGGVIIILVLAVYSGARRLGDEGADFNQRANTFMELVKNPTVSSQNAKTMLYTDTTLNTLFIIDNYPERFPYQPLHGAKFVISNPIPRFLWPGKPIALGILLQDQMAVDANLGPGIIGHGWQEYAFLGVIAYGIFFGLVVGFADGPISERIRNPFFLAVMVSGAGNIIGLPRGDTPLFFIQILASIVSTMTLLYTAKIFFGSIMRAANTMDVALPKEAQLAADQAWDHAHERDQYGDLIDPELAAQYGYEEEHTNV